MSSGPGQARPAASWGRSMVTGRAVVIKYPRSPGAAAERRNRAEFCPRAELETGPSLRSISNQIQLERTNRSYIPIRRDQSRAREPRSRSFSRPTCFEFRFRSFVFFPAAPDSKTPCAPRAGSTNGDRGARVRTVRSRGADANPASATGAHHPIRAGSTASRSAEEGARVVGSAVRFPWIPEVVRGSPGASVRGAREIATGSGAVSSTSEETQVDEP